MADLTEIIRNLNQSLPPIENLIFGFSYVFGIMFLIRGIYRLKVYGESRTMMSQQSSIKEPLLLIVIGAVFFYIPTGINVLLNTTFGYDNPLSYSSLESQGAIDSQAAVSVLNLVKIIGLITFIKGWYSLSKLGTQSAQGNSFGKSLTHIIGGLLAINIVGTINVVTSTLGISL